MDESRVEGGRTPWERLRIGEAGRARPAWFLHHVDEYAVVLDE
jgi:hypothetical protein